MKQNIYIVGAGMTPFARHEGRSVDSLVGEALAAALADAGCEAKTIQAAYYSGVTNAFLQGQLLIPGQVALARCGIVDIPVFNIENACASGTSAFHLAVQSLQAGAHDVVLVIGAEKMNIGDRQREFGLFEGGWDVASAARNAAAFEELGTSVTAPEGSESGRPYSRFMRIYAAWGRSHMEKYGLTQRQIAAVASKNHGHSVHNPLAQFRRAFSIEEVLAAPPITYPLTVPMCSPLSDGAAALVLASAQGLRRLTGSPARAVKVLASVVQGPVSNPANEIWKSACRKAAGAAYEQAQLGPEDISVAEVHDATAVGEVIAAEKLCLVREGEAGAAAERGDFTIGGRLPINPSGGLECKGHPIGATGLAQLFELVLQLRGEAGARQVHGARIALQENGGGVVGLDEAALAVTVLGK